MEPNEVLARLHHVAEVLLPGDDRSPAVTALPDLDALLTRALIALGAEAEVVTKALESLPRSPGWQDLKSLCNHSPAQFEVLSTVVAGAYFMSSSALDAIGYPHGPRRAAPNDLVVEELDSGILEPMLNRPSMVRKMPA